MALLPAPEAGRCPGCVTYPPARDTKPASTRARSTPGSDLPNPSATRASWLRRQTSSVANMTASSRAAVRGRGAAGWVRSWASTAATMASRRLGDNWHGSGVPWLRQGRATSGAGTNIPTARNRLLRNGPELGETADCQTAVSPASAGCSWPALVAGFGISRVLGSAGSSRHTANRRGGRSALHDGIASLQAPVTPREIRDRGRGSGTGQVRLTLRGGRAPVLAS